MMLAVSSAACALPAFNCWSAMRLASRATVLVATRWGILSVSRAVAAVVADMVTTCVMFL
jgi:hypothetical protein